MDNDSQDARSVENVHEFNWRGLIDLAELFISTLFIILGGIGFFAALHDTNIVLAWVLLWLSAILAIVSAIQKSSRLGKIRSNT